MSLRKIGDTLTFDFTVHNPSNGSVSDADSLPTCEVFEDLNDTPILTPVVVKRSGRVGDYRVSFSTATGFAVGNSYNVVATVVVSSITAKARIASFVLDSKRLVDLNDLSQSQILNDATPFSGADISMLMAFIRNKKQLIKFGSTWYLLIKDNAGTNDILKKALKDKDGHEISDIDAGVLAQEMASEV